MSRGFNWTRVAKEAQQRRYGTEPVALGLPAPESQKHETRGKPKRSDPPSRDEPSFQQKIASAVVAYMHAVAWDEARKMPVPAVLPILWRVLGQGADALKKVRGDRRPKTLDKSRRDGLESVPALDPGEYVGHCTSMCFDVRQRSSMCCRAWKWRPMANGGA